jgi:ABC-type proline/glycine betaine transport system ATPase subunit
MARALAQPSRLMLVEDTFGQFTAAERDSIFNAILDKANPSTSVIVSNDAEIAMRCDKIIIMSEGRIIKVIAPSDVQKESLFKSL